MNFLLIIIAVIMGFVSGCLYIKKEYKKIENMYVIKEVELCTYQAKIAFLKDNYREAYEAIKNMYVMEEY